MPTPTADVVVVAAGRSTRMDGVDKITADLGGRPLVAWSLAAFAAAAAVDRIVVVVPRDRVQSFKTVDWLPSGAIVVAGGERRQESVAAGVAALATPGSAADPIILVHDGARPAVRAGLIANVVDAAARHGAAIPVLPVVETLKAVDGERVGRTVDRSGIGLAQTPQAVRLALLRTAWVQFPPHGPETFPDEAALLEACTIPVHVVPGDVDNLKVTVRADLDRAAAALHLDRPRVGYAEDSHPFGPGEPLVLGGIELPGAPRLAGHSDGDVVLHAVASALLGAAGLPDLGQLFPADERTPRGVASSELLATVLARVRDAGLRPARIDVTIVAGRPRLGDRLEAIAERVAELVGVAPAAVAIKASSGNLAGPEGAGRVISARAVAMLDGSP